MNWSLYNADRTTHLKIVVVALLAGTLVAGFGIATRNLDLGTDVVAAKRAPVIKAGQPVIWTERPGSTIR
jgi:hypothetical protein